VTRQPFIHERVIRCQQIHHAAIFVDDAGEEQFRLLPHGLPQIIVEVGKRVEIRSGGLQIAQEKPLLREVIDQGFGLLIRQHPLHLLFQDCGVFQFPLAGKILQLVVGDTTP
jgi:hypothetical protein